MSAARLRGRLPEWRRPLAVVAHPDDESFGLGALLAAFAGAGAEVAVHCLTHGEASPLRLGAGELRRVRSAELIAAATELGLANVRVSDHPDGLLSAHGDELAAEVAQAAQGWACDGLVVFDRSGVTGHPDHAAATNAAIAAATDLALPVLEWTLPADVAAALRAEFGAGFTGHARAQIDLVVRVDRERQMRAIAAHRSQAVSNSPVWRRLELLGDIEYLKFTRPGTARSTRAAAPAT